MKNVTVYSIAELSEPALAKAHENFIGNSNSVYWQDEIIESLNACIKASGFSLADWSLGAYAYSWLTLSDNDNLELAGQAALDWLPAEFKLAPTGICSFTGYCADDDYIEALQKSFARGDTMRQAFENLASVCQVLLENEADYQATLEYFIDHAEANDFLFTERGARYLS